MKTYVTSTTNMYSDTGVTASTITAVVTSVTSAVTARAGRSRGELKHWRQVHSTQHAHVTVSLLHDDKAPGTRSAEGSAHRTWAHHFTDPSCGRSIHPHARGSRPIPP
eukprot:6272084-Prymnesium_polylepis.3